MAQNAPNLARMCLLGLKYLILAFDPYLSPKISNFAPKIAISSQNDEI